MRPILLAMTFFTMSIGTGIAENSASMKRCAALTSDAVRLACYDALAKTNPENDNKVTEDNDQLITTPVDTSSWRVTSETSPVDDTTKVFLTSPALEESRGKYGKPSRFTLMIACRENSTNIWVHFGGHFMSDYQHGRVTYRVDKKTAQRKQFKESNNHEALGLWNGGASIPFIKSLFGANRLFVQATPHSESAVDAEFDITGLETAIQPLRESCNW